jgi:hypothetical protein
MASDEDWRYWFSRHGGSKYEEEYEDGDEDE